MSNGWEWEDFEQALNKTANDPDSGGYDYNEDGTVGVDDWGAYQQDQQQGISESAVSGLGGFAEEGWSPGALVPGIPSIGSLPGADPTANFTVSEIPSIGSLPGADYDPMANLLVPDEEAEPTPPTPLTPYEQYQAAAGRTSNDPLSGGWDINGDGVVDSLDLSAYLSNPELLPSPDWVPGEIADPPGDLTGAVSTGDWYGADPALAGAAGTFTGDMSRDDLESMAYLFGDAIVPPGYEKIFGEIERDPFRGDWSEGRFRPYSYDIDLDDPKFDQYEPASNFLSDIWNSAEAAGFDSIENYLLDLQLNEDPNFERERDLYNYYAPIYEDLAPAYQAAKQEAFQESLRGQGTQDWLESETGADYMTQALGIFATAMGIDAADISPEIIEMLVGAATSGRLADFIDNYGIEGGETFSQLVSREVNLMAAEMGMTVSDVMATPVLLQGIMASVTASMGATTTTQPSPIPEDGWKVGDVDPQTGLVYQADEDGTGGEFEKPPNTEGMTWNVSSNSWVTPISENGGSSSEGDFILNNDFLTGFEYLGGIPPSQATGLDISEGVMNQGFSFGNFDPIFNYGTHIIGDNPIMGLNPRDDDTKDFDWDAVEAGDIVNDLITLSLNSAEDGGAGQGTAYYPAFLINAINEESSALMQASGGDPFAWWDSLSDDTKESFFTAYGDTMIEIADPTADIVLRDDDGRVTDYLMPQWFAADLKESSGEINHRAWSHLGVEERERLQDEAKTFYANEEDRKLISVVRTNEDGSLEYLTDFTKDDEANITELIYDDVASVQEMNLTRDPVESLTTGEFMKVFFDTGGSGEGWNILNNYYDNGGTLSDIGLASVGDRSDIPGFESVGGTSELHDQMRRQLVEGGLGPWASDANDLVHPEIIEYIANNIDIYLDLIGADKRSNLIGSDIDEDLKFGDHLTNVPGPHEWEYMLHGVSSFDPDDYTTEQMTGTNSSSVLSSLLGEDVGTFVDNVETISDVDNHYEVDWDDFFFGSGEAGEQGWVGVGDSQSSEAEELGIVSHFSDLERAKELVGQSFFENDDGDKLFYGIHELMVMMTPAYQGYQDFLNSKVDAAGRGLGTREAFDDHWTNIYKTQNKYDQIENLTERIAMEKQIAQDVANQWYQVWEDAGYHDALGGVLKDFNDRGGEFTLLSGSPAGYQTGGLVDLSSNYAYGGPVQFRASNGIGHYFGGGYVDGSSGGMDDTVPAVTDGMEPAKLSSGEFVIPADVVSHLGDGNNDNGASKLHDMMNRIRTFKTGNAQQPAPVDDTWVMPG